MRLNLRALLLVLSASVVLIIFGVYIRCADFKISKNIIGRWEGQSYKTKNTNFDSNYNLNDHSITPFSTHLQNLECSINEEYSINCKYDENEDEVYVPFSFLKNYFDVLGSLNWVDNSNQKIRKFRWFHTNSKINIPKGKYDPHGVYMYFENYNVEVRNRVKCISAKYGVPVSTQWEKRGYFYPTQIAQFALSHFSKNLTEPNPKILVLENGRSNYMNFNIPQGSVLNRIWHHKFNTYVVQYETPIDFQSAVTINNLNHTTDLILSIDLLLVTNSSSFMITVQSMENQNLFQIHYVPANLLLSVQDSNVYYGLGSSSINKWRHLTRDLFIDVQKSLIGEKKTPIKIRRSDLQVLSISFLGVGFFDNLSLSTSDHMAHFYDSAEWFVENQDLNTGGWPNPVKRTLNGFIELKSGWLSAMGQGHAISVLSRAYWHSKGDKRYLNSAALALKPFRVLAKDGGVVAHFMEKYFWYEEYPTVPSSYVLNGFIFSLLGLYDLNYTAPASIAREAEKLYNQGMTSLKKMLPFFDTGSGTSYDLRHISLGIAPNLARWDYHATHVNQLLLLATIDSDSIISRTAERWKGYMIGKRAKHN